MATLITKEEVLSKIDFIKQTMVVDAYPSLFSKEDVLVLLTHLADGMDACEEATSNTHDINLQEIEGKIKQAVEDAIDSYDIEDEVELEIGYSKQIDVTFDCRRLISRVKDSITEEFEQYYEEEVEVEVEENN